MGDQLEDDRGIWIDEAKWSALCERGKLLCPMCGNHPGVEDAEFFADEGCCRECEDEWDQSIQKRIFLIVKSTNNNDNPNPLR